MSMNVFSYTKQTVSEALVLTTSGYINQKAGDQLASECIPYIENGGKKIILDLENTKLINSIGIATIIDLIERLMSNQGELIFVNVNSALDKTLSYMGIFQLAKKANSVEEATS